MATRLQSILPHLVSEHQAAFIKGRRIHHNILLAHELVKYLSIQGKSRACIKVDLRKAFDSIRWDYLEEVLRSCKLNDHWINLCMDCITSARYSILINGFPEGFFSSCCGVRQGDPLSPLLFTLVIQSLSTHLNHLVEDGSLGLFTRGKLNISHLGFADDLLVFTDTSPSSALALKALFSSFSDLSGLQVNTAKSQIFASVGPPPDSLPSCLILDFSLSHWATICQPYEEGGLNIKLTKDWTAGAAGVRFWEITKNTKSMWAALPLGPIIKERDWIIPKARYLLFKGKITNLWYDPWINGKGLRQLLGRLSYDWGPLQVATISAFINQGHWMKPLWSSVKLDAVWADIKQIEIGGLGVQIKPHGSAKHDYVPRALLEGLESNHSPIPGSSRIPTDEVCKARGWLKLNTDGSLADDRGGYGAILRNNEADFIAGLAGQIDLPSINLLELKAIEWDPTRTSNAHLLESYTHYSEGNNPADLAAAYQSSRGETNLTPSHLWQEMIDAIEQDRRMQSYIRNS
ncbi:hypothetical protein QJS10_CPB22g00280 [Acorus calamus]|uniref:Reverse transcriptase domain-containing protein n=1 Tax=Acorus calamus TaxID=4465 RepID=A0AAV9C1C4_ACOCL|nr:hypothetical protein QJS10_CPB22g00280 [Acorus calamus]